MDDESSQGGSLPYYYNDNRNSGLTLLPFLVAPLGDFQATMILGPRSLASSHNQFINDLYRQSKGNDMSQGMSARAFLFRSKLCLAITLPTNLTDKGGRKGQYLTFGVLAKSGVIAKFHFALSAYIRIFIDNLNRVFTLSLPQQGAGELLTTIQTAYEKRDFNILSDQFMTVLDVLFIASRTVEDLTVAVSGRRAFFLRRAWNRVWRWIRRRKAPKAIMYAPGADYEDLLSIFLRECNQSFSKLGHTGIQRLSQLTSEGKGIISLLPAPKIISDASRITAKRQRGKIYIRIY